MIKQDIISAEAERLGFTKNDLDITFNSKNKNNDLLGWKIIAFYDDDNSKLKKLKEFIINIEYEHEINNLKPEIRILTNQINL